jgi:hypothetical protein
MTARFAVVAVFCAVLSGLTPLCAEEPAENAGAPAGSGPFVPEAVQACEGLLATGQTCTVAPCCSPKWRAFADFLYLRPGDDRIPFAVPINGAIVPPVGAPAVEVGKTSAVDINFQPGFRVGFGRSLGNCADVTATYTYYNGDASAATLVDNTTDNPPVLRSLVDHPGTTSAPSDFLDAVAHSITRFHLVDIDFRREFLGDNCSALRWLAGLRYAQLTQSFGSQFTNSTTIETVDTDIGFNGGGLRVGLEGERAICGGLFITGRGTASFVGGRFRTDYLQADNFRATVVDTGGKEDRVISILDLELALGWASPKDCLRLSAGYMFSGWYNVLRTNRFISSIRQTDDVDLRDTLTFDGLFARAEVRF